MTYLKFTVLLLALFNLSSSLQTGDCLSYFKVADNACADSCLPSTLGICPRSIIVSTGGLSEGTCATQGFTVSQGQVQQSAGPCGTLTFNKYSKPALQKSFLQTGDCLSYFKVADNACADSCLPSTLGICPRSIIVSTGGLSEGTCATQGFTVSDGQVSQSAGPCGTLTFNKYQKPQVLKSYKLSQTCTNYTKLAEDGCSQICLDSQQVGTCSFDQIQQAEGLTPGNCIDQGYKVLNGKQNQTLACGATLTYTNFIARCLTQQDTTCTNYYKFNDDGCSSVCLNGPIGTCDQDTIISLEGLKQGNCQDFGIKVLIKSTTKTLSCGADIEYTNYIQRCLKAQQ